MEENNRLVGQLAIKSNLLPRKLNQKFLHTLITFNLIDTLASSLAAYILILLSSSPTQASSEPSKAKLLSQTTISPDNIPGTIAISRFEINGNQVIPEEEIDRVLQPYLFRSISFIELLEAQQAITNLYINSGYLTSGAFIPPQTIVNRTIKVEIIEGRIEEIKITGLNRLRSEYIRNRLAIASQPPLNQDKLLNALQLLQLNPLIKNISAELSKGINPGGSFLEIEIEEADTLALELNLDNQQTPSIGSLRRQVTIRENNLLGFGDRFNVSYVNTDGSDSLKELSYILPVGAYDSTIRLAHSRTNSKIITASFEKLDLESKNRFYEFTYQQPLFQTPTKDLSLGLTFTQQKLRTSLMDIGFPSLSRGSDRDGITQISALRLFQEYNNRSENHVFAVRNQLSLGIDAFDATINFNNSPDSKFLVWRGQAQYLKKLTPKTRIFLRSDLQLADRSVVASEQFSAGGVLSVRGYNEDEILGDNGFFFSAELINTVWEIPEWDLSLELNPFFDFGRIWNSDSLLIETNTVSSIGVGLGLFLGDKLTARVDWGFPLIDDNLSGDSLQDKGVHFSLNVKPFEL